MTIRPEKDIDAKAVRKLNEAAFEGTVEAQIVEDLRGNEPECVSMVAVEDNSIVGHVFFSPVILKGEWGKLEGMGLAPMAVLPEKQRQGIGTELAKRGLEELNKRDCPFVIVLGHPHFYPRFGFERASIYGIRSQWEGVPDEAFMILWLDRSKSGEVPGTAFYREEFDQAM